MISKAKRGLKLRLLIVSGMSLKNTNLARQKNFVVFYVKPFFPLLTLEKFLNVNNQKFSIFPKLKKSRKYNIYHANKNLYFRKLK